MTAAQYKRKIKKACELAGTYHESFDAPIATLAGILETRDAAQDQYDAAGALPTIVAFDMNGNQKFTKNPMLATLMDLNNQALTYWRDLGLTPKGLKQINDIAIKEAKLKEKPTFAGILGDIG